MRLVHVQRLAKLVAKGRDEELADPKFHDGGGSHQHCVRGTLSRFRWRFASRFWVTLEGDTDAATLVYWELSTACTAGGRAAPPGRARFSAQRMRMMRRRDWGLPFGFPGVGVVERASMAMS